MAKTAKKTWQNYEIDVAGFPTRTYVAQSRGSALAKAMADYGHVDEHITFGKFLRIAKARVSLKQPQPDGYDYVREAYGVDVRIGDVVRLENEGDWSGREATVIYPGAHTAHVVLVMEGIDRPLRVHPDNVCLVSRDQHLARAA